jgi:hypothetical protein
VAQPTAGHSHPEITVNPRGVPGQLRATHRRRVDESRHRKPATSLADDAVG